MSQPTAFHQLGLFIVEFQGVERAVTDLLVRLSNAEDEAGHILVNELEYAKRLKALDVVFARFVDLNGPSESSAKQEFHKLIVALLALGERRNLFAHSTYAHWIDINGERGIIRENSRLSGSKGTREVEEEELLPAAFEPYLAKLRQSANELEAFRLRVVDWTYPDAVPRPI